MGSWNSVSEILENVYTTKGMNEMIKIGICDDEPIILEILGELVEECLIEMKVEGKISLFDSGVKVLDEIESLDILFLDIEMPKMDGIEVGHKIKKYKADCKIIMATSRVDRFKEAFKINAFDFVTKPFEKEEVKEALIMCFEDRLDMKKIEVYKERNKFEIYLKDIRYILAGDSYVEFILEKGGFRKEVSLTELEKSLDQRIFFRISRQCIVSMRWITKYKDGIIFMEDAQFRVSRRKKKEFERRYIDYDVGIR